MTQRPQVEVGRLADAVDMFIEGQSIVNSHSQTPDANRKFDADALIGRMVCASFGALNNESLQSFVIFISDLLNSL